MKLFGRAQLLALPLLVVALATAACGGGNADDGGNGAPEPTAAAPAAAACPIDEAALSEAIGVDMSPSPGASCGFVAASPQPGQVIEVYYTAIDAMVFDGSEGEAVAGVGDGARWDTQMSGSLLVKTGSRYFSVQAVAMGDLPDNLRPKNLAATVAQLILDGVGE